jgi:hypothetical protein
MSGEDILVAALRARYDPREWAVLGGVRNATGYSTRQVRTADAVALNLWPSKGCPLLGFELKVARSDWLRELKQPEKSWEIMKFCDQWWIAATPGVVKREELPKTWGLLELQNGKLKVIRQAPNLEDVQPLSKGFIVSLFREVAAQASDEARIGRLVNERVRAQVAEFDALRVDQAEKTKEWHREEVRHAQEEAKAWREAIGWEFLERKHLMTPQNVAAALDIIIGGPASLGPELRRMERMAVEMHNMGLSVAGIEQTINAAMARLRELDADHRPIP